MLLFEPPLVVLPVLTDSERYQSVNINTEDQYFGRTLHKYAVNASHLSGMSKEVRGDKGQIEALEGHTLSGKAKDKRHVRSVGTSKNGQVQISFDCSPGITCSILSRKALTRSFHSMLKDQPCAGRELGGGRASGPKDNGSNCTYHQHQPASQTPPLRHKTHTCSNLMTTKDPSLSNINIGVLKSQNSRILPPLQYQHSSSQYRKPPSQKPQINSFYSHPLLV